MISLIPFLSITSHADILPPEPSYADAELGVPRLPPYETEIHWSILMAIILLLSVGIFWIMRGKRKQSQINEVQK